MTCRMLIAACIAIPLAGCGSSNAPKNSGANITLKDENNYSSTSTLTLTNVDTAAGADASALNICWTGLTQDLQCHDVSPQTDIKNISLVRFPNKAHDQAQVTLIAGNLKLGKGGDVDLYREHNTDGSSTCVPLSSLQALGDDTPIVIGDDYVDRSTDSYVIIASNNVSPGVGARSMVFVTPKTGNTNTTVDIPSGCNKLDFKANLHELTKVSVPAKGPWIVDWTQVTKDSERKDANLMVYEKFDLILGYYDMSVTEIENDFFDIETNATKMWKIENIPGEATSKNLAAAHDSEGNLFTGFEPRDAIWALGLQCPSCQNPAPMFLTILDTSSAGH